MLSVKLNKRLGDFSLNMDFHLVERSICALFGPSGSGKSTLINCISGLLTPDDGHIACEGEVWFDSEQGVNLPPERRETGYVFQDGRLFPHLNVRENLLFGRRFRPGKGADALNLDDAVDLLGIGHLLRRMPATLSGGEKQRVAIGRALLCRPRLLLMDEPLTALDPARRDELMDYIARIPGVWKVPILYVTHSVEEALRLAPSTLLVRHGRPAAFGSTADVLRDAAAGSASPLLPQPSSPLSGDRHDRLPAPPLRHACRPAAPFCLFRSGRAAGSDHRPGL